MISVDSSGRAFFFFQEMIALWQKLCFLQQLRCFYNLIVRGELSEWWIVWGANCLTLNETTGYPKNTSLSVKRTSWIPRKLFRAVEYKRPPLSCHTLWSHTLGARSICWVHTFPCSVEALIFFRLLPSNCLNWKIYCDDHSSLSSTTAVQIWISYIFHKINFDDVPRQIQKTAEKPLLICDQKRWKKRIPYLKQWNETSGKRYPSHQHNWMT